MKKKDRRMTKTEKGEWLIRYLTAENERYKNTPIPQEEKEQFNLYRALVNMRLPMPVSEEYLKIEDAYLQEITAQKGITPAEALAFDEDMTVWQGDITTLACDAIVNAANSALLGCFHPLHNCIDNCIHTFAGVRLRLECHRLMQLQGYEEPTGQAKITPAYNLPCRYVLHTVGPIVNVRLEKRHCELLASCYRSCLETAEVHGVKCLAFCCISTGVFGFPQKEAAQIALDTVRAYKAETGSDIRIIFNVFKDEDREIYESLLR